MSYYGIVIEQSLQDKSVLSGFVIKAEKQVGGWRLLLVHVADSELENVMTRLQDHMIAAAEDCWYAHFFSGEKMVVVYQNGLFRTTTDPRDWEQAVQFGLDHGIPAGQLDYEPRTVKGAFALFGLEEAEG